MRNLFIYISLPFILLPCIAKAQSHVVDSIDFYYVYYNNIKIGEYNLLKETQIVLKRDSIKETDSLKIQYFRISGFDLCSHCSTTLRLYNNKGVILASKSKGENVPISFALKYLLDVWKENKTHIFGVDYTVEYGIYETSTTILCSIKLE